MKIIIAGAGEVGTHLAKLLSREEQDIILIDNDEEKLREPMPISNCNDRLWRMGMIAEELKKKL